MSNTQLLAKDQRRRRVRSKISGTAARPRLNIFVSNKNITAQLIDDVAGVTLAAISTTNRSDITGTMTEKAVWVGGHIAELGKKKKISAVVFDRGTKIYHGRLHALADAARGKGLEF